MIGKLVGAYRLKQKLGEGATGETYLAEHKDSGEQAAVKILFPQMCTDAGVIERFLADIKVASLVNHSGVADLFDSGVLPSGQAFVIGEYLQGKTLTDALVDLGQVTDMASMADLSWQVATMLGAAHEAGIIHGALKPDALFLTFPAGQAPRPLVKLVDFGMAKFRLGVRQSQTGSLLGAPLYMSPESGRGIGTVDHRADIYSLGCIMFEMICGRPPFVRAGAGELIIAHAKDPAPFASSLEPSIPQAIDQLIGRMLTKNPLTRPQAMAEVATVLERFFQCPTPVAEHPRNLTPVASQPSPGPVSSATSPAVIPLPVRPAEQQPCSSPASPPRTSATAVIPSTDSVSTTTPLHAHPTTGPTAILPAGAQLPAVSATAMLPPERVSAGVESTAFLPPQPSWLGRVRQKTVLTLSTESVLDVQPSAPIRDPSFKRSTGSRSSPRRSAPTPSVAVKGGVLQSINVPIVVISAALLLVVSAVILLVTHGSADAPEKRKHPSAGGEIAPAGRAATPPPGVVVSEPTSAKRGEARSGTAAAETTHPEDDVEGSQEEGSTGADDSSAGRNHPSKDKGRPRRFW